MTTLGDIMMKKTSFYYFLDPSMKPFIQTLQKLISMYFCSNQLSHFKYKFYDHETSLCRILKTNPINFQYLKCEESFYVNLICSSIHYSNRFGNGDLFLEDRTNQALRKEVMWIKETKIEDVLQDFILTYFQQSETHTHEKDVLFLWKLYIKEKNYINIFQKNIQEELSRSIPYQSSYFMYITSMKMPYVKKFIHFWNKYMYEDKTEQLYHANDVIKLHLNKYNGWTCNAGIESLMINWDGDVHRATCRVGGSLGNIYEGDFVAPSEPMTCDRNFCTCAADIPLTKLAPQQVIPIQPA
jgi:hypothetical protein